MPTSSRRSLIASLVLVLAGLLGPTACGRRSRASRDDAAPPAAARALEAGPADPAAARTPGVIAPDDPAFLDLDGAPALERAVVGPDVEAAYRARLAHGRELAKAGRYPEAVTELEAALTLVHGDPTALTELAFAAMKAGARTRALILGREAVRAAREPRLEAAARYNLGRFVEDDHPEVAASLYRSSLALRPSDTVEARLDSLAARLAVAPPDERSATAGIERLDASDLPCTSPQPRARLCPCLVASYGEPTTCKLSELAVPGLAYATYGEELLGASSVLVGGVGDRWQVLAQLGSATFGASGVDNGWSLESARARVVGGREVIELRHRQHDVDRDGDEVGVEDTERLTICVRAGAAAVPACTVSVRVRESTSVWRQDPDTGRELSSDESSSARTVAIGADGVVRVQATDGETAEVRLW